jgi:hypothetical protein
MAEVLEFEAHGTRFRQTGPSVVVAIRYASLASQIDRRPRNTGWAVECGHQAIPEVDSMSEIHIRIRSGGVDGVRRCKVMR